MRQTTSETEERLAYLALANIRGLGSRRLGELLSRFGSPLGVLRTPFAFLGPKDQLIRELVRAPDKALDAAARFEAGVVAKGITVLTPADEQFPTQLRSIPDPPMVLYAIGHLELVTRPAVALVGSRDHSGYGRDVAQMLASAAASVGIVVVSGMARGLDAVAHQAALDAHGTTIGVLGNGIGYIYPRVNLRLYEQVERDGLLLTESPPGLRPYVGAFPRRNRLISGLAKVLVVVEAAKGSGTMLTVASALEQGREVMAVPGPITSSTSAGTNQLLRDGADPLLSPDDLLARFSLVPQPNASADQGPLAPPPCNLSPEEARVFDALSCDGRHIDELTVAIGLPVGLTLGILFGLELGGLAEQLPGSSFRRAARYR